MPLTRDKLIHRLSFVMDTASRPMILVEPTRANGLKIKDQAKASNYTKTKTAIKVAS